MQINFLHGISNSKIINPIRILECFFQNKKIGFFSGLKEASILDLDEDFLVAKLPNILWEWPQRVIREVPERKGNVPSIK